MWPNPQVTADLVSFTEEILNRKFHFLCSVFSCKLLSRSTPCRGSLLVLHLPAKDLKCFFHNHFLRVWLKLWCPFFWSSKKSNNLLRRSFSMLFSLSVYHSSRFLLLNVWSSFSANTCLKVTSKKLN